MAVTIRKADLLTEKEAIVEPPLRRLKTKTKPHPLLAFVSLAKWLIFPFCLFFALCSVNALMLMENELCNWQKKQIKAKEMQVHQIRASIALRLSKLTEKIGQAQFSHDNPTLLTFETVKRKPTLLGRR
ncbi:MAG: hypothetical protein NZ937_05150 [Armatimonadetes bacterium]|nr:hypothetical protein [Armatimonadota bacterium]